MIAGPFHLDGGRVVYVWREPKRATLTAFYLWLLVAFIAGAIAGVLLVLAFSGAPSTADNTSRASSALTSAVDGGPVRAGRMVEAPEPRGQETARSARMFTDESRKHPSSPSSTDPARATAIDELPGSDPLPLTTQASGAERDLAAVLAAIDAAATEFGHEAERMRIVTFCESSWNPLAIGDGGTSFGLWQFQMPTWRANVRRAGFEYSDVDVFDPVASSRVAGWIWANGGELLWTCAR